MVIKFVICQSHLIKFKIVIRLRTMFFIISPRARVQPVEIQSSQKLKAGGRNYVEMKRLHKALLKIIIPEQYTIFYST